MSGIKLSPALFLRGATNWRFQVLAQFTIFCVMPGFCWIFSFAIDDPIYQSGIILMGCLPTTISSSVILTSLLQGDEASALFAALLSNILGVFVSPLLASYLLGLHGFVTFNALPVIGGLVVIVILPLLAGQLLRPFIVVTKAWTVNMDRLRSLLIFLIIYTSLSKVSGFYLVVFLAMGFIVLQVLERKHALSLLCSGTQKTLALGVPLIGLLGIPESTELLVPLITYHFVQLLLPSFFFIPRFREV
jgi:sodium/bile acid cotransporter 7